MVVMRYLILLPIGLIVEALCERINPNWKEQRAKKRFEASRARIAYAIEHVMEVAFRQIGVASVAAVRDMARAMGTIDLDGEEIFYTEGCIKEGEPVAESQSGGIHGAR